MKDKFIESIKNEIISQIEEIIGEVNLKAKEDNLSNIDTLVLVNNNINSWISSINRIINIDDEILTKVAELKKPFVSAAKKEIAKEVSRIIENEQLDVTSKINDFMNVLKNKGINLDGKSEEALPKIKEDKIDSNVQLRNTDFSSLDSESSFGLGGQRILKKEFNNSKESTSDCPPDFSSLDSESSFGLGRRRILKSDCQLDPCSGGGGGCNC